MIITPHILVGAVIGAKTQNLGFIIILGLLSHFILDKIPHWDYEEGAVKNFAKTKNSKYLIPFFIKIAIDAIIGLAIISFIIWQKNLLIYLNFILLGILISVLPDILLGSAWIFSHKKLAKKYINFHKIVFHNKKYIKKPSALGLATQIIVIIISVFLLSL